MQSSPKKLVYNEVKEISFLDELIQWSKNKSLYYWIIIICSWLSIGLAFYHLFVAVYGTPEGRSFRSVHLSVMMILAVFIYPVFRKSINDKIILPNDEKGNFLGSVSGGCVETSVITECVKLIKNKNLFKKIDFKVSDENAWEVGLACGGEMTVFIEQIN